MFRPPQKARTSQALLYVLLLCAVAALMLMLRQCSSDLLPYHGNDRAGGDTLNVAIELSPLGVTMEADTLTGEYYNLLRRVGVLHGINMKFHPFTRLSDALAGLNSGRYSLVVSDIPVTSELRDHYIFVDPLPIDHQVLVQKPDSTGCVPITNQFDLGGKTICLPQNSPFIPRIKNLAGEIGDTIYITEDPLYSSEQMIMMVATGELPNVVASQRTASLMLRQYPELDASLHISFNQFQGWAMAPRDSVLCDSLRIWIMQELKPEQH